MFGYGRLAASEGIYYRVVCCWKGERGVAFHHVAIILDMLALYIYNYMTAQPPWSLWVFGEWRRCASENEGCYYANARWLWPWKAVRSQEPNILNTMEKIPLCAVSKVVSGQKTVGGRFSLLLSLAQEGIPGLIIPRGTYVRRYLLCVNHNPQSVIHYYNHA